MRKLTPLCIVIAFAVTLIAQNPQPRITIGGTARAESVRAGRFNAFPSAMIYDSSSLLISPLHFKMSAPPAVPPWVWSNKSSNLSGAIPQSVQDLEDKKWVPNTWPPEDTTPCLTGAEKAWDLVISVTDTCSSQATDPKTKENYKNLIGRALVFSLTPVGGQLAMKELISSIGTDAMRCALTGMVVGSASSPEAKEAAKASLEAMFEIMDTKGDLEKAWEIGSGYRKFGREFILKNEERKQFLSLLDRKVSERWEGLSKPLEALDAISKLESPDRKSRSALAEAEKKIKACEFEDAARLLETARKEGVRWLYKVRELIIAQRKTLRCLGEDSRNPTPEWAGGGRVQAALTALEKGEAELLQFLRNLRGLHHENDEKLKALEKTRAELAKLQKEAEAALDGCDFRGAETKLEQMKQLALGWCGTRFAEQHNAYLQLHQKLNEKKGKVAEDEKAIANAYQTALRLLETGGACEDVASQSRVIERIMSNASCIKTLEAEVKLRDLRSRLEGSERAARQLQHAINAGNEAIQKCDGYGLTAAIGWARQELPKIKCKPLRAPGEAAILTLEAEVKRLSEQRQALIQKIDELVASAKWAAKNCDRIRVQGAADQLKSLLSPNAGLCPSYSELVSGGLKEVKELLDDLDNRSKALEQNVTAAGNVVNAALARCDLQAAQIAMAELNRIVDANRCPQYPAGVAEIVNSTHQRLDNAIKAQQALIQNATGLLASARDAALKCDVAGLEAAYASLNRLADAYAAKCPVYPEAVRSALDEIQKLLASAKNNDAAKAAIAEGERARTQCDAAGMRAAAQKLLSLGAVCGIDVNAEAERLNKAAEGVTSYLTYLEENVKAASDQVKEAADRCDLQSARLAMAEVNRLTNAVLCPNIPESIPKMVQNAFARLQQLENNLKGKETLEKEIQAAMKQGDEALNTCNYTAAKAAYERAISRFNNHQGCPLSVNMDAAKNGASRAEQLMHFFSLLNNSLSGAEAELGERIAECSWNLNRVEQGIEGAQIYMGNIQSILSACDLSSARNRVAAMRSRMGRINKVREDLPVMTARVRFLTPEAKKRDQAALTEIKNILNKARRDAQVAPKCFAGDIGLLNALGEAVFMVDQSSLPPGTLGSPEESAKLIKNDGNAKTNHRSNS